MYVCTYFIIFLSLYLSISLSTTISPAESAQANQTLLLSNIWHVYCVRYDISMTLYEHVVVSSPTDKKSTDIQYRLQLSRPKDWKMEAPMKRLSLALANSCIAFQKQLGEFVIFVFFYFVCIYMYHVSGCICEWFAMSPNVRTGVAYQTGH